MPSPQLAVSGHFVCGSATGQGKLCDENGVCERFSACLDLPIGAFLPLCPLRVYIQRLFLYFNH